MSTINLNLVGILTAPTSPLTVDPLTVRVVFNPTATPSTLSGPALALSTVRSVQTQGGTASIDLIAGTYTVTFQGFKDTLSILVPNDTAAYNLTDLLTTTIPTPATAVLFVDSSGMIALGSSFRINTNTGELQKLVSGTWSTSFQL